MWLRALPSEASSAGASMPADKAFEMTASLQRELETLRLRPNITSEPSVLGDGLRFIDADAGQRSWG